MTADSEMLKWGALGFVALMVLAVVVPLVRAFVNEMRRGREERERMAEQSQKEREAMFERFAGFVSNEAAHHTAALHNVARTLQSLSERVGGLPCTEEVEPVKPEELAG